jgi:hypothetical protein
VTIGLVSGRLAPRMRERRAGRQFRGSGEPDGAPDIRPNETPTMPVAAKLVDEKQNLRERSGNVRDGRPLVRFLYVLLRGHVHPGDIEDTLLKIDYSEDALLANGWLARYAQDIADRLGQPAEASGERARGIERVPKGA